MPVVTATAQSGSTSDPHSGVFSPPCKPGDVIDDKYRVEKIVGAGGMAWVFEATHLALHHKVALKILRVDTSTDNAEALARFQREARAAAAVSGEATARVMDVGSLDDGSPFLVMELLEGCDLDSIVQAKPRLPVSTVVGYLLQACQGVAETHAAGVVHRDLKPSNLFLTQGSDGTVRIKLLDFGISKITDPTVGDARVTVTRALVGSPVYMSPEQMRGSRDIDGRTDIWSLGVILYELLADGTSPFEAPTLPAICARVLDSPPPSLRKIRREVPRALEAVILKCLQKDPDRRFQTVAELAEALVRFGAPDARERAARVRRILDGSEIELRRVKPSRARPRRWLAGALVLAALAGVGVAVLQQQPEVARSSAVAARAWSSLASHLAQASAVAIRPVAPTPPAPDPSPAATPAPAAAIAPPSAPAGELGPTAAAAGPASPAANVTHGVSSPPPQVTAARSPSPLDSSSSASIAALLAEARGDAPSEPTAAKGSRARAMHHAWHKHYTAEPVPSPDPAPPIVAGPAAEPPARSAPTTTPTAPIPSPPDLPTPYDEPVPDLGSRD